MLGCCWVLSVFFKIHNLAVDVQCAKGMHVDDDSNTATSYGLRVVGKKGAHVFRLTSPVLCVDILEGRAPTKYRHCLQAMSLC